MCSHLYFLAALVCASTWGGGGRGWGWGAVWFREPLCPFIAEEWRLFTHAVGVRALTSISRLWLVKMQFWTCSRLVNVWRGGRSGAKLKTMIPLVNDVDWLISHFCQLMSAKRWNLPRVSHKAILLNETLLAFRAGGGGWGSYLLVHEFKCTCSKALFPTEGATARVHQVSKVSPSCRSLVQRKFHGFGNSKTTQEERNM